jgi:hypothetical protein
MCIEGIKKFYEPHLKSNIIRKRGKKHLLRVFGWVPYPLYSDTGTGTSRFFLNQFSTVPIFLGLVN